jgi:hypothetical protein
VAVEDVITMTTASLAQDRLPDLTAEEMSPAAGPPVVRRGVPS